MVKKTDVLGLNPHWHLDCRLEAELPQDNVVGARFLVNAIAGAVTVFLLLAAGWLAYRDYSLREEIEDWDRIMASYGANVNAINRDLGAYAAESRKITHAHALMKSPLQVTEFVRAIGQTRPDQMEIDVIETGEGGLFLRGRINETFEPARRIYQEYIAALKADARVAGNFEAIAEGVFDRAQGNSQRVNFSIIFRGKAAAE